MAQTPPHDVLAGLRRGLGELLDEFYQKLGKHHESVSGHVVEAARPPAEAGAHAQGLEVSIELPGVDEKDIEITLEGDRLFVRGEKREAVDEKTRTYHLRERRFGAFERSFALPADADAAKISARYDNGVLSIAVPRKKGAKAPTRKIPVKGRR